jgi:hypothetical protein
MLFEWTEPAKALTPINSILSSTTAVPASQTLVEIARNYPNYIWGDILRVYIAEGWDAEAVWRALPANFRHNTSQVRPWNYLQQAFGRKQDIIRRGHGN